jgi:hypothetical protein
MEVQILASVKSAPIRIPTAGAGPPLTSFQQLEPVGAPSTGPNTEEAKRAPRVFPIAHSHHAYG